ncbi:four-carbon acid sugar kinase family protein [Paenibacillus filicis]|uniref:Four-carbon acid sugar kinase family protein n=1 Tax=Paenibacillus gyeongsangnamensis TaxID=3388067 RepID=A0ABT4QAN9_9BACL|nr:four-carbon acid sugar kinase family protein [Paenibacillus filicis]MCZ8513953.1 four-carbon acid sugar kinase family protein [Paenibacillus filicis]
MERISIIADDLTGASDSGVQFARNGLKTQVIFDWTSISDEEGEWDVIVIDTDSRSIAGKTAYDRVKSAALALKDKGFSWIYKKMDSTLRGNLGQEIGGVMDAYGFEAAFIAPAFPRIGRTTVGGIHYLNGMPIHETEMARDPKTPVPDSDIARMVTNQSGKACANIGLSLLREGSESVCRYITDAIGRGTNWFVFDAETDEDLTRIAALFQFFGSRVLWAGSAGLAEFLLTAGHPKKPGSHSKQHPAQGPVMLVAGSLSGTTREQVAEVNRQAHVTAVEMDPIAVIGSAEARGQEIERCIAKLQSALSEGTDASLYTGSSPEQVAATKERGAELGLEPSDVSNRIADALGAIASKAVSAEPVKGLVLTGGDTAKAVCRYLGVHGIELRTEVEPGIPYGMLLGGVRMATVTKAGAFGNAKSLWHAMQFIHLERGE